MAAGTTLTSEVLQNLYVRQDLTAAEVAQRVGVSKTTVLAALRQHGIPIRPAVARPSVRERRRREPKPGLWDAVLTKQVLEELYVREGLTAEQVAGRLGVPSLSTVLAALRRHGLPVQPRGLKRYPSRPVLTRELLTDLYLGQQLSAPAIAGQLGYSAEQVRNALARVGIPRRRGGEKDWSGRPPLSKDLLTRLYVQERLSVNAIAAALGYGAFKIREALDLHGIPTKRPSEWRRHFRPRTEIDKDLLEELYVGQQLSGEAIGHLLRVHPTTVRLRLHEYGIPVRPGGDWGKEDAGTVALRQLYHDPEVMSVLRRFGVPRRELPLQPPDRSTQKYAPPQLDPALLEALYVGLGLSAFKIELLTGADKFAIFTQLRRAGVPVRSPTAPLRPPAGRPAPEDGPPIPQKSRQLSGRRDDTRG
jgi:transposase